MTREAKKYDDDDGRVIASMDVEGMPWHNRRARSRVNPPRVVLPPLREEMTRSEIHSYIAHSLLAALTIVGVFAASWVLFILFLLYVWAR